MLIIVLAVATVLMAVWLFLLAHTEKEDWIIAAYNKILANQEKMTDLQEKDRSNAKKIAEYSGAAKKAVTILLEGNSQKQITKLQKENGAIQHGNMQRVDILSMPGFVLQRKYDKIATGDLRRKLLSQCKNAVLSDHRRGSRFDARSTVNKLWKQTRRPCRHACRRAADCCADLCAL